MKTKIKILTIIILSMVFCSKLFSQSYVLQDPVLVPVYLWDYNVDDIDTRDYFWDITEINNNNDRLDVVVGLNQIQNATTNNYINANWYKNQYDDNFNEFNSSTKFINQFGYQYTSVQNV